MASDSTEEVADLQQRVRLLLTPSGEGLTKLTVLPGTPATAEHSWVEEDSAHSDDSDLQSPAPTRQPLSHSGDLLSPSSGSMKRSVRLPPATLVSLGLTTSPRSGHKKTLSKSEFQALQEQLADLDIEFEEDNGSEDWSPAADEHAEDSEEADSDDTDEVIPVKAKRTKKVGFSLALPLADVGLADTVVLTESPLKRQELAKQIEELNEKEGKVVEDPSQSSTALPGAKKLVSDPKAHRKRPLVDRSKRRSLPPAILVGGFEEPIISSPRNIRARDLSALISHRQMEEDNKHQVAEGREKGRSAQQQVVAGKLKRQLQQKTELVDAMKLQLDRRDEELSKVKQQMEELKEDNKKLTERAEAAEQQVKQVEEDMERIESKVYAAKNESDKLSLAAEVAQKERTKAQATVERLQGMLSKRREANIDLRKQIKDANNQAEADADAAEKAIAEAEKLRAEAKKLRVSNRELRRDVERIREQRDELREEVEAAKAEISALEDDCAELRKTRAPLALSSRIAELEEQTDRLRYKLLYTPRSTFRSRMSSSRSRNRPMDDETSFEETSFEAETSYDEYDYDDDDDDYDDDDDDYSSYER